MKNNYKVISFLAVLLGIVANNSTLSSNPKGQNLWQPRDFSSSMQDIYLLKTMYYLNGKTKHSRNNTFNKSNTVPFWANSNNPTFKDDNDEPLRNRHPNADALPSSIGTISAHGNVTLTPNDIYLIKSMHRHEKQEEIVEKDHWNGTFSIASRYAHSFEKPCNGLGSLPFWSGTNTMTYGSNDGKSDIDAYQFGMGMITKQGSITLTPTIVQIGSDMLLYFTQHKNKRGFYFKTNAPIGATSVSIKLTEVLAPYNTTDDIQFTKYPAPGSRNESMTQAFQNGSFVNGDEYHSSYNKPFQLNFGRIPYGKITTIRIGDIKVGAGYKVHTCENGSLDIGVKVSCPTGNVPQAQYILEPIFGKAGHWGFGGETTGHYNLWKNDEATSGLNLWMQAEIMHLVHGRRPNWRSFDLKQNGPGSKYLVIQHYAPFNATRDGSTRVHGRIDQAINLTTMPVKSSFKVEGSAALLFDFYHNNWNGALGTEFYGRSKESLSIDHEQFLRNNIAHLNDYAVLGRQIGYDSEYLRVTAAGTNVNQGSYVALYLCEPLATINKSEARVTVTAPGITPPPYTFPNTTTRDVTKVKDARIAANRIPASLSDALDICGAQAARMFNAKISGQVGYTWKDNCYRPNLSITSDILFTDANTNSSINMWSVGMQGSIAF